MRCLFIFGTRPEAIKLSPLILKLKEKHGFQVEVCITAQHRQMLDQILDFFKIKADYDLDLMSLNQGLYDITTKALKGLEGVLQASKPDIIFVQGDTTTAMVGALAGFYSKIKVAHVEAGLRSGDLDAPFPEEGNRLIISKLAYIHFTPTDNSSLNLNKEGHATNVFNVGNTVIDALLLTKTLVENNSNYPNQFPLSQIDFDKRIILVTSHRRESFGIPFENICKSLIKIANLNQNVEIVYPVHLNPNVRIPVKHWLSEIPNIKLIEPLNYPELIWLMNKSYLVLTDSGGIQEEAPSLGKPVLVLRDVTERSEGIDAGTAKLVGTDIEKIFNEVSNLLENKTAYHEMSRANNPYGDGKTCERIIKILQEIIL